MKLQQAVKRETAHIALGTAAFTAVENACFALAGRWDAAVLAGSVLGAAIAVGNFFVLALTVQAAAATGDEKRSKLKVQFSYSLRMLVILLALVAGFALPWFNGVAMVIPLLFPRLTIFLMQLTGAYKPDKGGKEAS